MGQTTLEVQGIQLSIHKEYSARKAYLAETIIGVSVLPWHLKVSLMK